MKNAPAESSAGTMVSMDLASANDKVQSDEQQGYYKTAISNEIFIPTEEERKLAFQVYDRYWWLRKARKAVLNKDIEQLWDKAEEAMTNYVESLPDDDDRSNLFIPVTHATVDSILAEWYAQHTSGSVTPARAEEDAPKAEIVDFCRQYIEKKNDILQVDAQSQWELLTYGNTIQYVYYKQLLRKIHDVSGQDEGGNPTYVEKIVTDFDDICIENQDLRMFFPDDAARKADFSDMGDCIVRKIVHYDDFEVEYSNYPNYKFVKIGGDLTEIDFFQKPRDLLRWDVEVLWWWNKKRDFLRIVANGVLLCDVPLPYDHKKLPFVGAGDNRRPGSFWWIGEPELIEPLQEELNVKRNVRTDAERIAVLSPIFAPTTGRLEDDEIIVEPGKIYYYQGVLPPTQLRSNTDFAVSFQGETFLKDDIAFTTGVDKNSNQPINPGASATEVVSEKEQTLKRIAKKIYMAQLQLEVPRGQMIVDLIMQYYTVPKIEQICGPEKMEEYAEAQQMIIQDPKHYFKGDDQAVYKKSYRQIRVDNKAIVVDPELNNYGDIKGVNLKISDKKGYTFFEATPEIIKGEYLFTIIPDVSLPVTKAQQLELNNQLYDRLIQNAVINSPDGKMYIQTATGQVAEPMPKGLLQMTKDILESNGKNFEDYIPTEDDDDHMLLQAGRENVTMMSGEALNSTPLADPAHTMVHVQFVKQNNINAKTNPNLFEIFQKHVAGEQAWQKKMAMQVQQQQALQQAANNAQNGQPPQAGPGGPGGSQQPPQAGPPNGGGAGIPGAPQVNPSIQGNLPMAPGGTPVTQGNGPAFGGRAPRRSNGPR